MKELVDGFLAEMKTFLESEECSWWHSENELHQSIRWIAKSSHSSVHIAVLETPAIMPGYFFVAISRCRYNDMPDVVGKDNEADAFEDLASAIKSARELATSWHW